MRRSRPRRSLLSLIVAAGMIAVPAGLFASTTAQALTATQRLDLRALVVVSGNPGCDYTVDALETAMTQAGVPYTEVNLSNAGRPIITDAFLSTTQPSGIAEGFYNSVFMTNDNPFASFCLTTPDATATAEMTALANYETTFGVRQVDSYTFPGASVGLTSGFEGSLDGMSATVTAAGLAGPFSYLNGPLPIDNYDPNVSESYGYLGIPAPAAGQTFTPLVDAPIPGGTTRGSLAGVFSDGSRQQLVLSFLANANQTYFQALAHGIITWATNGVHLGYSRNYFSVVVDDMFSDDSQWSPAGHCTPGEDCPIGSTITTPNLRMVPADVTAAVTWEAQNNFRFTFAFNGEASDSITGALPGQPANTAGLVDDPLTDALLANKSAFDWINHTYSHLHLGCVQNITVRPWVCQTTDGQPVNCPSVTTCNILWQTAATIEPEITNNILFAKANGITIDPTELVSGEYSGLYYLPQEPIDNPNFITALNATGVKVTAADASRQFTTRPVGNAITSPRYPMSVWYNVDTVQSEIDEYNWLYAAPPNGGGFCQSNPAIVTCLPAPLTYTSPTNNGFLSYIVPTETRLDLQHIMTNDPRPHYIHQPNLTGDRIVYPVMNSILGSYHSFYGASAPIVELTETAAANIEVQQQAWQNTAPTAVTAYLQNGNVTVQSNDATTHNVPVTVSPGTTVNGAAFGTPYEGDLSGWLSAKPPTPQTIQFTAPSTGTVGGTATLTATGGASGNPVVFTVDPSTTAGVCNVAGTNGATLNYTAVGTCKVDANQAGNATFAAAPQVQQSVTVTAVVKANQTITFAALANRTGAQSPVTVTATASSGLPVTFTTTTPTVCTAGGTNGSTITLVKAGTCTVVAAQAGNATFNAAPSVTRSFTVTKANQTITLGALPNRTRAQSPVTVSATASSGLAVTVTSLTPGVCTTGGTNGATLALVRTGPCIIFLTQAGNALYDGTLSLGAFWVTS